MTDPRRTNHWKQLAKRLCDRASHCAQYGRAIDHHAKPRSRWAPSADHITPIARGGAPYDPADIRIVHCGCNARRAARIRNFGPNAPPATPPAAAEPTRAATREPCRCGPNCTTGFVAPGHWVSDHW